MPTCVLKEHSGSREVSLLPRGPMHGMRTPLAQGAFCIPSQEDAGIDGEFVDNSCSGFLLGELVVC